MRSRLDVDERPQVRHVYRREDEERLPPPRRNAAERFRSGHREARAAHGGRGTRAADQRLWCPRLDTLRKRRSVAETRVLSPGGVYLRGKMSESSLCPECVESLTVMRRKRRRQGRTRHAALGPDDAGGFGGGYDSYGSDYDRYEDGYDEEDGYERSYDSRGGAPSVNGDALMMMRAGTGGRKRLRLEAGHNFLCPDCVKSLRKLNAVAKRRHQEKVLSGRHTPRYRQGGGARRSRKAAMSMDYPCKRMTLGSVDGHVFNQPIENVTKMVTAFVNRKHLPARNRELNVQTNNANLDDPNANLNGPKANLEDSNGNLDDSNANLDDSDGYDDSNAYYWTRNWYDWVASDESQEQSLSVHKSFPSLSDEPMVQEDRVQVNSNSSKNRQQKRSPDATGAGVSDHDQDSSVSKEGRRDSSKTEGSDEPNEN